MRRVLVPGWDVASSRSAVALGERLAGAPEIRVNAAAGIHPHVASGADDEAWAEIVALTESDAVAAVGETGLDYDRAFSPHVAQLVNLRRHLRLEALQVANDLHRLVGLLAIDVRPRQLVPAVRAHGLQLGVALQRGDRFEEDAAEGADDDFSSLRFLLTSPREQHDVLDPCLRGDFEHGADSSHSPRYGEIRGVGEVDRAGAP